MKPVDTIISLVLLYLVALSFQGTLQEAPGATKDADPSQTSAPTPIVAPGVSQPPSEGIVYVIVLPNEEQQQQIDEIEEHLAAGLPVTNPGGKSPVTVTMNVSAGFDTVNCAYWSFQVDCMHWGTDYVGQQGDLVFTPFDLTVTMQGSYPAGATGGQYIQGHFNDGYVFYAGHLQDMPQFEVGQTIPSGTVIGRMNEYNHSHVQFAAPGNYGACAQSGTCLDFEVYYNSN